MSWALWQWATCPGWAKLGLALIILAVGLQLVELVLRSWRGVALAGILVVVWFTCGCERAAFEVPAADAAAVSSDAGPVSLDGEIVSLDAEPLPACGPSPVTIDRDCGGTTDSGKACMVAAGLAKAPCLFQGGYLVAACSQCWWLP